MEKEKDRMIDAGGGDRWEEGGGGLIAKFSTSIFREAACCRAISRCCSN